jgi:hypothetical protein
MNPTKSPVYRLSAWAAQQQEIARHSDAVEQRLMLWIAAGACAFVALLIPLGYLVEAVARMFTRGG